MGFDLVDELRADRERKKKGLIDGDASRFLPFRDKSLDYIYDAIDRSRKKHDTIK